MLLSKLSTLWSSEIFHYIKPTGLIKGIISCYRKILDPIANADSLPTQYPVGRGRLYETVNVPFNSISENVEVAGVGRPFYPKFKYTLVGAPTGIIRFGNAVSGKGAELYADFVEFCGIYYFKKSPTSYGVIDTHQQLVTYIVSRYDCAQATINCQNSENIYAGSTTGYVNCVAKQAVIDSQATGGISASLVNLIGGITLSQTPGKIELRWKEGDYVFAKLSSGELLRLGHSQGDELAAYGTYLDTGHSGRIRSNYLIIPDTVKECYDILYVDDVNDVVTLNDYPVLTRAIPELGGLPTCKYKDIYDIASRRGICTMGIGKRLDDPVAQRYIESRINQTSANLISSCHKVDLDAASWDKLDSATDAYIYLSPMRDTTEPPHYFVGIDPDTLILRNVRNFSIARSKIITHGDRKFVIVTLGRRFGDAVTCNHRLHAISFFSESEEKNYRKDSILHHIELTQTPMHAGGCVVLVLTKKNSTEVTDVVSVE